MSLRKQKIQRLQESQKELKKQKSGVPTIQMQQQALRRGLLLKKPVTVDRKEKIQRFKESQKVARDLALQRAKEKKERERVVEQIARRNQVVRKEREKRLNGMFFPRGTIRKKAKR